MTSLEMQAAFEIEAGIIDNPDKISTYDIFYWLNRGIIKFVKTRYSGTNAKEVGFEQDQKRIDDLRELVTEVTINTTVSTIKPNSYIAPLPGDYLITVGQEAGIVFTATGESSRQGVTETTIDRYRDDIDNPFSEHVYYNQWARPLRLFYGSTMELISDGTYTIPYLYLRYLKTPATITLNVNCDLAPHTHSEIVKIAAQLYLESVNTNRYKTITNEVNTAE